MNQIVDRSIIYLMIIAELSKATSIIFFQDILKGSTIIRFFESEGGTSHNYTLLCLYIMSMVPEERLELSHLAVHDFESCASTSSATPATRTS